MADLQRRGGIIQVTANGVRYDAKGNWTWNLGRPKREAIVGSDGPHGYKETPQVAFIEGEVTDRGTLDVNALVTLTGATVALLLATGKTISLNNAWYAGEGTGNTDEGNIGARFEAVSGEET